MSLLIYNPISILHIFMFFEMQIFPINGNKNLVFDCLILRPKQIMFLFLIFRARIYE